MKAKGGRGEGGSKKLAWLSVGVMLVAAVVINLLGDRFWWTVPIIFGPRWVWGAVLVGTLPQLFLRPAKGIWPLLAGTLILVIAILDVRVGIGRLATPTGSTLRVLEFNAEGNAGTPEKIERLADYIATLQPDIVVLAECSEAARKTLRARLPEYAMREGWSLCLLAAAEVLTWDVRNPKDFWIRHGAANIIRTDLRLHGTTLRLGLVHLATPRRALAKYNDSTKVQSMRVSTETNRDLRDLESQAARFWITEGETRPFLVAGDFNLPVASAIYRRHWGDLENAFSSTGVGFGHTKHLRLWGVRIDHILAGNGMKTVRTWIGPDLGSDHMPLIAEIALPR